MSACTTYALKSYSQKDMLSVQVTEVSEHPSNHVPIATTVVIGCIYEPRAGDAA